MPLNNLDYLLSLGPTGVPGANLLLQTMGRLGNGEDVLEVLRSRSEHEFAEVGALVSGDEGPNAGAHPSIRTYLGIVDEMVHLEPPVEPSALEDLALRLTGAATSMETAFSAIEVHRLQAGPTPFPQANTLIHLSLEVGENPALETALRSTLSRLRKDVEDLQKWRQDVSLEETPSMVSAAAVDLEPVLEKWGEVLSVFEALIDQPKEGAFELAVQALEAAAVDLDRGSRRLQDGIDRKDKVPCVRCGHFSRPDRPQCETCGARLPISADLRQSSLDLVMGDDAEPVSSEPEPVMTRNVHRLLEVAHQASDETLPREAIEAEVERMERLLSAARASGAATDALPESPDGTSTLFHQALSECEMALSMFRGFAQGAGEQNLAIGSDLLRQSSTNLQKVQRQIERMQA